MTEQEIITLVRNLLKQAGRDLDQLPAFPGSGTVPPSTLVGLFNPVTGKLNKAAVFRLGLGTGTGEGAVFPDDEPPVATQVGNLPAGTAIAGQPVVEVLRQAFSLPYQVPSFNSFTIQDAGSQTVEVDTPFSQGFKSVKWSIGNGQNVAPNSVGLTDVTGNTSLLSNEPNDGTASASFSSFTAAKGESRRYRISARNTQGNTFSADVTISGDFLLFYGPVASKSTTSAEVRALPSQFSEQSNTLLLNTGVTQRIFEVNLPPGKVIGQVVDLDNLNQVITADYVRGSVSVTAAAATSRAYNQFVKTQAVPYTSNHRHQITLVNG